jgi:hypothetical protein
LFCWLIFTLAVYALTFFVATSAGIWAYHTGAGLLGTPLVAVAAGGVTLAIAQIAFAMTRSLILRAVSAALFACRPHLLAIMSFLQWRKSEYLRLLGERSLLASARSSSTARRRRV